MANTVYSVLACVLLALLSHTFHDLTYPPQARTRHTYTQQKQFLRRPWQLDASLSLHPYEYSCLGFISAPVAVVVASRSGFQFLFSAMRPFLSFFFSLCVRACVYVRVCARYSFWHVVRFLKLPPFPSAELSLPFSKSLWLNSFFFQWCIFAWCDPKERERVREK